MSVRIRSQLARWLLASAVGASVALAAPAQAVPLVVFGDSLSDSGNMAVAGFFDPAQVVSGNSYVPSATYAPDGVYSNGPVWVTSFAAAMGWTIDASLANPLGSNFAFGGARITGSAVPSLLQQTQDYLGRVSGEADANALYVVAGGGNDARDAVAGYGAAYVAALAAGAADPHAVALAASLPGALQSYVLGMGAILDALQGAGATRLLVWNLPYLGAVPAVQAAGLGAVADGIVHAFNTALDQLLAAVPAVQLFDLYALGRSYVEQPAEFGFTNVHDACGAATGADCSSWLWWDGIHPTAAAHQRIASAMVQAVTEVNEVAEPPALLLLLAGMGLLAVAGRTRGREALLR